MKLQLKSHTIWFMGTWLNPRLKFDFLLWVVKNIYRHWQAPSDFGRFDVWLFIKIKASDFTEVLHTLTSEQVLLFFFLSFFYYTISPECWIVITPRIIEHCTIKVCRIPRSLAETLLAALSSAFFGSTKHGVSMLCCRLVFYLVHIPF